MARPAWQIQQQRVQQQRQLLKAQRNHQEGIGYIKNQNRLREKEYSRGNGLGTAVVGAGVGAAFGGPVGAAIGGVIGWFLGSSG